MLLLALTYEYTEFQLPLVVVTIVLTAAIVALLLVTKVIASPAAVIEL